MHKGTSMYSIMGIAFLGIMLMANPFPLFKSELISIQKPEFLVPQIGPMSDTEITEYFEVSNNPRSASDSNPPVYSVGYVYWHHLSGYSKQYNQDMAIGLDFTNWDEEWRGWTEWDITSIPDFATITYVGVQFEVNGKPKECDSQRAEVEIYEISNLAAAVEELFQDIGDGTQYYGGVRIGMTESGFYPGIDTFYDLGGEALSNFTNHLIANRFSIGLIDYNDGYDEGLTFAGAILKVSYTASLLDDSYEENDNIASAQNMSWNTYPNLVSLDPDYFSISMPEYSTQISIRVDSVAAWGQLELKLFAPDNLTVLDSISAGDRLQIDYCVEPLMTGIYVLAVLPTGINPNQYTLTLSTASCSLITIISPSTGGFWNINETYSITWTAPLSIQYVNISLLLNTMTILQIALGIPNNGSILWQVPDTVTPDSSYRMKIIDANRTEISTLTGYFTIQFTPSTTTTEGITYPPENIILGIVVVAAVFFIIYGIAQYRIRKSPATFSSSSSNRSPPTTKQVEFTGLTEAPSLPKSPTTPSATSPKSDSHVSNKTTEEFLPQFCPFCGMEMSPQEEFCSRCGNPRGK